MAATLMWMFVMSWCWGLLPDVRGSNFTPECDDRKSCSSCGFNVAMASHASLSMCSWVPWYMFWEYLVVLEVCCREPVWLVSMRKVYVFGYIICTARVLFSRCSLPQLVWPLNFQQQNLAQAKATWRKISLDSPWPVGFTLGSSFTSKRHQDEDARFGHGRVPLVGRCRCWDIPKEYPKMKVLLLRPLGLVQSRTFGTPTEWSQRWDDKGRAAMLNLMNIQEKKGSRL